MSFESEDGDGGMAQGKFIALTAVAAAVAGVIGGVITYYGERDAAVYEQVIKKSHANKSASDKSAAAHAPYDDDYGLPPSGAAFPSSGAAFPSSGGALPPYGGALPVPRDARSMCASGLCPMAGRHPTPLADIPRVTRRSPQLYPTGGSIPSFGYLRHGEHLPSGMTAPAHAYVGSDFVQNVGGVYGNVALAAQSRATANTGNMLEAPPTPGPTNRGVFNPGNDIDFDVVSSGNDDYISGGGRVFIGKGMYGPSQATGQSSNNLLARSQPAWCIKEEPLLFRNPSRTSHNGYSQVYQTA